MGLKNVDIRRLKLSPLIDRGKGKRLQGGCVKVSEIVRARSRVQELVCRPKTGAEDMIPTLLLI